MEKKVTLGDAERMGRLLGVDFELYPVDHFRQAMEIELEHGTRYGAIANVTNDHLLLTAMIVVAHILEYPDYYERLIAMEEEAEAYWKGKQKPNLLRRR